ncbi:hypothetical protein ATCC90586_007766 [Pythium insidiosum]|nr:hypothetical protein ATCC90586_007766 [Pythium insidiosum]
MTTPPPPAPTTATATRPSFDKELHALYFLKNLKRLPPPYASQDSQRVVLSEYTSEVYDTANIASTYAALCILRTLGDDLSRVDKVAIIAALRHLQNKSSGSYDGSIGITADAEGQGGAVFCAIASLVLSGRLMQLQMDQSELLRWLVFRQQGGFQGRCNKVPDSCYAFWNGATLDLLGKHHLVDIPSCRDFILSCQFPFGGLCKYPDGVPDVMHSYYSLAWLSIASNGLRRRQSKGDVSENTEEDDPFACLVPLDTKLQVPFFPKS